MKTGTKKNKPGVGVGRRGPAQEVNLADSFAIDAVNRLPEEHAPAQLVDVPADASETELRVSSEPCLFSTVGIVYSTAYTTTFEVRMPARFDTHVDMQLSEGETVMVNASFFFQI